MQEKLLLKTEYWTTPNSILSSPFLTFKAKGLYGYIQSKPSNWEFSVERIAKETKDGRDWINGAINELINAWYLERTKFNDDKWQWKIRYQLFSTITEKPLTAKPSTGNPSTEKPKTNKERIQKDIDNIYIDAKPKKESKPKVIQTDIMSEEIYCHYVKDMPSDKKKYMKKGQSLLYIASLLQTYDSLYLLSCISTYKKQVEPKWWKAPQYFFANTKNANAKEYMFFLDYAPAEGTLLKEETGEEKKERMKKALAFFNGNANA